MKGDRTDVYAEYFAYWYFRLNGFLTIPNFVVHPNTGSNQRTDVDLLGVRFPYRAELAARSMPDDSLFALEARPLIVIAEVKRGLCSLNGPWTEPKKQNLPSVLRAIGLVTPDRVPEIADQLYESGRVESGDWVVILACVGSNENAEIASRFPEVPQITWSRVKRFVYERFTRYARQKASHGQWDATGRLLFATAYACREYEDFDRRIRIVPGPPPELGDWRVRP